MKRRHLVVLFTVVVATAMSGARGQESPKTPIEIAAAYLAAMEASDLDAAESLFAANSVIFETGGVEGSWKDYRERHIGPELDSIESFTI